MNKTKSELREKAEQMVSRSDTQFANMSSAELKKLLYEFQVHQIELQLQNEELKYSQQELMISRDRYMQLYNLSPVAYFTLDEAGVIKSHNPAAAQLLGSSAVGLINKKLGHFIHPLDQDRYHFFIQDVLTKQAYQTITARLNTTEVKLTYVKCQGTCGVDEIENTKICLCMYDITTDKKAQQTIACLNEELQQKVSQQTLTLKETNEVLLKKVEQLKHYKRLVKEREVMLNSIFNAAVEGIITMRLSGEIVYTNNTVESIFGYGKDDLVGMNIDKLIPVMKLNNSLPNFNNSKCIGLSKVVSKTHEVTGLCKDGSTVSLDISIARFSIDGARYLTTIVRDITFRKLREQRDQLHLDELAHVTRLGLMGELASGIAHEVNQPLSAITSYTQASLNLIADKNYDSSLLNEILQKTNEQALKAGQIIHRMRDFVKSKKIHRSTVNINNLIQEALGLCDAYLKHNHIHLNTEFADYVPALSVDNIQIEQVILNLVKNSIDALTNLPHSKIRSLSIQTVVNNDNEVEVRIKDNGPGIDPSEQVKIFTPFYTSKNEGMGMGLSICCSILEAHKGILRFNSQPEKGTTFYFTLPVQR